MASINYLCLSFILGLIIGLFFIPSPSLTMLLIVLVLLTVIFIAFRPNRLTLAIVLFYILGVVRPAFDYDVLANLNSLAQNSILTRTRQEIKNRLLVGLPEPKASLAYGILFGTTKGQGFDRNLLNDLRRTGTAHMVAVSGYNVSIITGILLNTSILVFSKAFFLFGILGLIFYDFLVGFSASVVRATIMALFIFAAGSLGRQKNFGDALVFSATIILLLSPKSLLDLGFQLSFLAMLGVLYLSPLFEGLFRFLPKEVNQAVSATFASQIMILPVSVYDFGQISLISPLANVLTFLTVPAIMFLTGLDFLFGGFLPQLYIPNYVLLEYFIRVVKYLGNLSWASVSF